MTSLRLTSSSKLVVVKSNTEKILSEGDTRAFVYEAFERLPGVPHVPEVHERFSWNGVQYIDLPTVTVEPWIDDTRNETEKQSRFGIACQAVASVDSSLSPLRTAQRLV